MIAIRAHFFFGFSACSYFPSLGIKQILNSITIELLGYEGAFRSLTDQVDFIREHYEAKEGEAALPLYLIVHNIDGPMIRGEKAQNALSRLANIPGKSVRGCTHLGAPVVVAFWLGDAPPDLLQAALPLSCAIFCAAFGRRHKASGELTRAACALYLVCRYPHHRVGGPRERAHDVGPR